MKSRSGTRNGFTTAEGNQPSVQIQVYQGECEIAAYNKKLGMFELTGLPSAFRGLPQIEVTFDIDSRGSIDVAAKDLTTGAVEQMGDDVDHAVRTDPTREYALALQSGTPRYGEPGASIIGQMSSGA